MDSFINAVVSGMISGSLYAIMALGLTIIYGVSRVFNFAHGHVAVIGAYIVWFVLGFAGAGILPDNNLSILPGMLLALIFMFIFGIFLYYFTIRYLMQRPGWEFSTVIFTLGLGILLENIMLQVFGPRVKSVPIFVEGAFSLGSIRIGWHELFLILVVLITIFLLNSFLRGSRAGQAMRAVAQSIPGARIVGIDIERIFGYTFALGFAVTGFSGILLGTKYYMTPHIGWEWMIKGFIIVSFGGLGSVPGSIVAAFVLGIAEALATLYLGTLWVWPTWFVLFVAVLFLRPQGILGGRI
jgi:branched-chain amino acid transport system permease protein